MNATDVKELCINHISKIDIQSQMIVEVKFYRREN